MPEFGGIGVNLAHPSGILEAFMITFPGIRHFESFHLESLWSYIVEAFSALHLVQRIAKNPLFEVISLHGPTDSHRC